MLPLEIKDTNALKADRKLAINQATTYVRVDTGAIKDANNNDCAAITDGSALLATKWVKDATKPTLTGYDVDMTAETITVTFSETVAGNKFDATALTLQSTKVKDGATSSHKLTKQATLKAKVDAKVDPSILTIVLGTADANSIKLLPALAESKTSTFVSFEAGFIEDVDTNQIKPVEVASATNVGKYTQDSNKPVVSSFAFDVNAETIKFVFNEPVAKSTVVTKGMIVRSAKTGGIEFQLTGHKSRSLSANGLELTVTMLPADVNSLKSTNKLVDDKATTFISVPTTFIKDIAGNTVTEEVQQAATYVKDINLPLLAAFELDMNAGTFRLSFSETVDASTVQVLEIVVESTKDTTDAKLKHTLQKLSKCTTTADGLFVDVKISTDDLDTMKQKGIGASKVASFVILQADAVKDVDGNGIKGTTARAADKFVDDTTSPVLASFDLSMNTGKMEMTFSEVVRANTFLAKYVVLQNANGVTKTCPCSKCLDDEFLATLCTATKDTVCTKCKECAVGSYESKACSAKADSECTVCETCGAGKYLEKYCKGKDATVCQDCATNCKSCTGPGAMCTACEDNFHLKDGICVDKCGAGMFSSANKVCTNCHSTCESCFGAGSNQCSRAIAGNSTFVRHKNMLRTHM